MAEQIKLSEIMRALLGDAGVNTISEKQPVAYDTGEEVETIEGKKRLQLKIFEEIDSAIENGKIKYAPVPGFLELDTRLAIDVDKQSLFQWFCKNPEILDQIRFDLSILDRSFPETWTTIIKNLTSTGRPPYKHTEAVKAAMRIIYRKNPNQVRKDTPYHPEVLAACGATRNVLQTWADANQTLLGSGIEDVYNGLIDDDTYQALVGCMPSKILDLWDDIRKEIDGKS
jgi:hypothetical protein